MNKLLIFACLGMCYCAPLSSPCTEDEILQPKIEFNDLVKDLENPHTDREAKLEQIRSVINKVEIHYKQVNAQCGEEKVDALEKITNFRNCIDKAYDILLALETNDLKTTKDLFESIHCKYVIHFLIAQIEFLTGELDKIVDASKLMTNDPNAMNKMHEAIIYTLNNTNINLGKLLIPIIKLQIARPDVDAEELNNFKLNLKKLAQRTAYYYPDALLALNEIDSELADQAIQETVDHVFTNSLYNRAYVIVKNAPTVHLKTIGLKTMQNKINSMNLQNSLAAAKIFALAEIIKDNEGIEKDDHSLKILNDILQNQTKFNQNVLKGYSCRTIEQMELFTNNKETEINKHNEYFIFHDAEHPNDIGRVFTAKEDGSLFMINVETKYHSKNMEYSVILDFDEFPEDVNLPGTIISKQRLGQEDISVENICKMNPKPQYNVCIPIRQLLNNSHNENIETRKQIYESLQKLIKSCPIE